MRVQVVGTGHRLHIRPPDQENGGEPDALLNPVELYLSSPPIHEQSSRHHHVHTSGPELGYL